MGPVGLVTVKDKYVYCGISGSVAKVTCEDLTYQLLDVLLPHIIVHIEDERLVYLNEEFLKYFEEWDRVVITRQGNFKKSERNTMNVSYQTLEGLNITVKSVTECIKFCLDRGMPFVLTDKFNQDAIEQHFGIHRASCGSNTNPTLNQFNCSLQKQRIVGSQALAPMRGNSKRRIGTPDG